MRHCFYCASLVRRWSWKVPCRKKNGAISRIPWKTLNVLNKRQNVFTKHIVPIRTNDCFSFLKLWLSHHMKHTCFSLMYMCSGNLQSPNHFYWLSTVSFISVLKPTFWKTFRYIFFVCECVYMCASSCGWRWEHNLWELISSIVWALGIELRLSRAAAGAFTHWAVWPTVCSLGASTHFGLRKKPLFPFSFSQMPVLGFRCHLAGEGCLQIRIPLAGTLCA